MLTGDGPREKIGLQFSEKMAGYLFPGEDFFLGEEKGREEGRYIFFEVVISIADIEEFCRLSGHKATLSGFVSARDLGEKLPIRQGKFFLFVPEKESGQRQMIYSFSFTGDAGEEYFFYGYKNIKKDPQKLDFFEDLTTLFIRVYKGAAKDSPLWGSGIMRFKLSNLPQMLTTWEINPPLPLWQKMKVLKKFFSFCFSELRDTYLAGISPIYYTEYENLILSGQLRSGKEEYSFFFFSGIHDNDFPWGDGETFADIALVIQQGEEWIKFALTDRIIEGLFLDVEKGSYQYAGPLYLIREGQQLFSRELKKRKLPNHLDEVQGEIEIRFDHEKYPPINIPFGLIREEEDLKKARENILEWIPQLNLLGFNLTPFRIFFGQGKIVINQKNFREKYDLLPQQIWGEAEKSTLQNLRWPKLAYQYNCSLKGGGEDIWIKLETDVLWKKRRDFRDQIQEALGRALNKFVSLRLNLRPGHYEKKGTAGFSDFSAREEQLLEIINDHFPTAVLKRQAIKRQDKEGNLFLTLKEETDPLNLGGINSEKVVKVAAIKEQDKFAALKKVLEQTNFFHILEKERKNSGKNKEDFAIIIKPNFMFMYSRNDPSTYTDPELVEYLIGLIYEEGYRNIACAEARSTYGVFFTNREVKNVAHYIGLKEGKYGLLDLSQDLVAYSFPGKLGKHFVNREWKDADFRVSFAKNKTHSYAFYTLTIKNIYGALPLENKFLEYHHKRDIFDTAIEFIQAFPIHFALIDAYISADGPFGIFADKKPNFTQTIIGSEDLVATDWIGAAKMGLDPMISDYMKKAVEALGKPQIQILGDCSVYPDWVNVSDVIPLAAFNLLDRHYYFGNLFYSIFAYMDDFFQYKDPGCGRKIGRILAHPLKALFFQKVEKGELDEELNKKLFAMFNNGQDIMG
ncbi:MAG: DUF362 domain-containing protein [Thermodesulfobacteriota bacterium]